MRIARPATGELLAADLRTARGMAGRMLGLMGKRAMPGDGLLIEPADSIHTFFMRMPIDLVFLDGGGRILKLCPDVAPWRIRLAPRGARRVLEMPAGWCGRCRVAPGDILILETTP
jgi:uncharacterized membrane protein (UPF0127 family)